MIDIYVISLTRATNRRQQIVKQLEGFAERYVLIDAVDARDFTASQITDMIHPDRRSWANYLRPGAVCCALSHLKAYREFLDTDAPHCLILEDDAELRTNKACFDEIINKVTNTPFGVISLASFSKTRVRLKFSVRLTEGRSLYVPIGSPAPGSALAYIINRSAATAILNYNQPIKDTADAWSNFIHEIGLTLGFVSPNVFGPVNLGSTIDYIGSEDLMRSLIPSWIRKTRRAYINWRLERNVLVE
jgi:glycosyl transferase, family 25